MREDSGGARIREMAATAYCPDCSQDRPLFEFAATSTGEITYHDWLFCLQPQSSP